VFVSEGLLKKMGSQVREEIAASMTKQLLYTMACHLKPWRDARKSSNQDKGR
jgi:hypothetical protein